MLDISSIAQVWRPAAPNERARPDALQSSSSQQAATKFVIEREGPLRFAYSKRDPATGEEIWRWPAVDRSDPDPARGRLIDLSA